MHKIPSRNSKIKLIAKLEKENQTFKHEVTSLQLAKEIEEGNL